MSWYQETPERFPSELRQVMLRAGDVVHQEYHIIKPMYVSGTELCYHAKQTETGIDCLLFEMIPLRWCSGGENGVFVPYHEEAQEQWDAFRASALKRLSSLQNFAKAAAVPTVKDGFEEKGTIWYVTRFQEAPSLESEMAEQTYTPKQAVTLLAPLLDTLSGMHQAKLYHGAISAGSVRLVNGACQLRDWLSFSSLSEPSAIEDVRAVSLLLFRMMTGEPYYKEEAAAKLPAPIRAAVYNGLYDPEMTIGKLWKQLHTKKAVKCIQTPVMQTQKHSLLAKVFSPVVTAVFCLCCVAAPVVYWQMEAGALISEPESEVLDDVPYALHDDEFQMPELLYMDQKDAMQTLENLGLNVIIASREDNPVVPENQVVTQNPDAGAVVCPGDQVTLTISDGWTNFVPNVVGMPFEDAEKKMNELGFVVKRHDKLSPDDAPGTVITQGTKPDTKLARDSLISLTVSLGREDMDTTQMETVGNNVGMDFEKAKAELSEVFLYAVQIDAVFNKEIPAGVIISQDIKAGSQLPQGSVINMVVSKGVETAQVPDVTGLSTEQARTVLAEAKLLCIVTYVSDPDHQLDYVLKQSIPAGDKVPLNTEIWLEASVGSGSYTASTGGWSGAPLPEIRATEPPATEAPTEAQTEAPQPQQTAAATDAPKPAETDPPTPQLNTPPAPAEEELEPPPMPVD